MYKQFTLQYSQESKKHVLVFFLKKDDDYEEK